MKISRILNLCVLIATITSLASCKQPSTYHEVGVKKFAFRVSDMAPDLVGITFVVDSVDNVIYNIDSVSYTSDITQVTPVVTCYATPSEVRINDNAWNQTDCINVTDPFKLTIVGSDKKTVRNFTVTVNKHKVDQNKVSWVPLTQSGLDAGFRNGKAVFCWGEIYFTGELDSGDQSIYSSPDATQWTLHKAVLENSIDLRTLYAPEGDDAPDSLFAIAKGGSALIAISDDFEEKVYKMPDGIKGVDIIGENATEGILLLVDDNGAGKLYKYLNGEIKASSASIPSGFPTLGYAAKCNVHIDAPVIKDAMASYLIGGKSETSDYGDNAFSTDNGWYWINVIKNPKEKFGFEGLNSAAAVWYDKRIFIFGGKTANAGDVAPSYFSEDTGFTWSNGDESVRLPESSVLATDISVVSDDADEYLYAVCGKDKDENFKIQCFRGRAVRKDFIIK